MSCQFVDAQFDFAVDTYREQHEGPQNAGKTLFISGGTDVKTVGQTFENLAMKATQGGGETRIAAAAGVPPVIVGLSEGLSSATYSKMAFTFSSRVVFPLVRSAASLRT